MLNPLQSLRLCRFVKDEQLWAQLAAMSIAQKELSTAEVAYAAIDEVRRSSSLLLVDPFAVFLSRLTMSNI